MLCAAFTAFLFLFGYYFLNIRLLIKKKPGKPGFFLTFKVNLSKLFNYNRNYL